MQWPHDPSPRFGQNVYACAQPVTCGVVAMGSCFGLLSPHQNDLAVGQIQDLFMAAGPLVIGCAHAYRLFCQTAEMCCVPNCIQIVY